MPGGIEAFVRRVASRRVVLLVTLGVVLLGLAMRAVWLLDGDRLSPTNSEMFYVARAFAETGRLADAYGPDTGLTAHVTPVMPLLAGGVYRAFGVGTPAAELVLTAIALSLVGLSLFAVDRAMARLDVAWPARLMGLAGAWLLPLNLSLELQVFRVWEGALAAAAVATVLASVLRLDQQAQPPGWKVWLCLALAGGALALVSPPAALAIYACAGLLALRRRGVGTFIAVAALCAIVLAAISYPWALRNEAALGERVWSRTNFGFNFALGYYDGAVAPADPRAEFLARLEAIDPYTSESAREALRAAGGETGYSDLWTERTKAWVAEHPMESARIAVRHVVEYFFPPDWMWNVYSDTSRSVGLKQALVWLSTVLAGLALAWRLLAARDWRYLYVVAVIALPALPYILAQPILRYRYVTAALLVYLAASLVWRIMSRAPALRALDAVHPTPGEAAAR